jgi:2-amino-4-hydroxy-6-hydroxymethyldihydropteridine diphosphokinase
MKKLVYLSLGSNVGNRQTHMRNAIARLESLGRVVAVSSLYETEPVEFTNQPWFLNCAVAVETEQMPKQFMAAVLKIEREMGRRRTQEKGPRTIDIDILLFGNATVDLPELTIPHPAMHERRFVLQPLNEIAPDLKHPVLKKTIRSLRDDLPPGQAVNKLGEVSKAAVLSETPRHVEDQPAAVTPAESLSADSDSPKLDAAEPDSKEQ